MKRNERNEKKAILSGVISAQYLARIERATTEIQLEREIYNAVFDKRLGYDDCIEVTAIARYRLKLIRRNAEQEYRRIMRRNIANIQA